MNEIETKLEALIWDQATKSQMTFERYLERIKLAQYQFEELSTRLNQFRKELKVGETNWVMIGNRLIAPHLIHEVRVRDPETEEDAQNSRQLWEFLIGDEVFSLALTNEEGKEFLSAIGGSDQLDLTDCFETDQNDAEEDKKNFNIQKLKITRRDTLAVKHQSTSEQDQQFLDNSNYTLNGIGLFEELEKMGFNSSYSKKDRLKIIYGYLDSTLEESQNIEDFARFVETNYYVPNLRNINKRSGMRI